MIGKGFIWNMAKGLTAVALIAAVALSCGKKSKTDAAAPESQDVVVAGQLNLAGGLMADLSTYDLYCVTFASTPASAKGQCDTTGNFSLTLANSKNVAFGCFVRKAGATVATMVFEDPNKKGIDGDKLRTGSIAFNGNVTLGTISVDLTKGTATVDMSKVVVATPAAAATTEDIMDFTGTWKLSSMTGDLPTGYSKLCSATPTNGDDCHGPREGELIFFQLMSGKEFAPDATCVAAMAAYKAGTASMPASCNGTPSTNKIYGVMAWTTEAAYTACGSKTGFTDVEAKSFGVDLSASTNPALGAFTWASSYKDTAGTSHTITEGWKVADAKAPWMISTCTPEQATAGQCNSGMTKMNENDPCNKTGVETAYQNACYAMDYQQRFDQGSALNDCVKTVQFNWGDPTAANALSVSNEPRALHVVNKIIINNSKSATVYGQNSRRDGFQIEVTSGSNTITTWKSCAVFETFGVTLTFDTTSTGLMDMRSEVKVTDTDATCVANKGKLEGAMRILGKITKQ